MNFSNIPTGNDAASLSQLEALLLEYPYCSTLRMLLAKNHKALNTSEKDKIIKETAIYVPDRKKYFDFIHDISIELEIQPAVSYSIENLVDNEEIGESDPVIEAKDDLIDKFIREQPRISAVAEDDFTEEEDKPTKTELEQEFVSEILAEIYWKQGNHNRAISIYEKLCLKIPEKSSYFAAQIQKIKQEII